MNKTKIVGFTGNIGVGKTTASKILVNEFGYQRLNFKDALLLEVKENFPDLLREINSYYRFKDNDETLSAVPRPPLVRALLQNYGTDVRRKDYPWYWTNKWKELIELNNPEKVVVDDVRFQNEAFAIDNRSGILVRIQGKIEVTQFRNHISETEMTKLSVDLSITNHGTLEEFQEKIRELARTN